MKVIHASDYSCKRMAAYLSSLTGSGRQFHDGTIASWKTVMGNVPIAPAESSSIRDFIRKQASSGRSGKPLTPQTLKRMLAVISDLHVKVLEIADPTKHLLVTSEMKALYRERGSRPKSIVPLRLKGDIADIVRDNPLPGSIIAMLQRLKDDESGWALRAKVILGLGADTGRNRSDYVRLNIGDVLTMPDGSGQATFRLMPTALVEQAPRYVSPDTMAFIRDWVNWREKISTCSTKGDAPMLVRIDQKGIPGGRLSKEGYVDVLQEIIRRVGDGAQASGNSFRAGLKLDLAAIGTTKLGIANALGFKDI
ncbi:hypothetical protein [uncultured Salinicola sp.]|uniref:hypothetical protein n=1 Tax=uncultured Salinicola sp. TaxID=1193542 RepID=UPI002636E747|nr:hypothetical protein [uncultured Salinicola sp.]